MSKLRVNEFVNHEDNGSPNFPHSAVVPTPTANNHFANKLYSDISMSVPSPTTNIISKQPPQSPSPGDFWTDISRYWTATSGNNIISLNVWNGSSWINVKNTQEFPVGQIISTPSITSTTNSIYSTITASPGSVSDAYYLRSRWYLNDVEIPRVTGREYYATKPGTYKYEEIWINAFEDEVLPNLNIVIGDLLEIETPLVLTPSEGEGVGLPRSYTPKSSAITSIDFDSSWTPPATGISDINHQYLIFSSTNAYDGSTELSQSLTEAFPAGTQLDIPGGGYVSSWTSNPDSSAIMVVRKDEKDINQSTYIDNASVRDTFPQNFNNLYHMPGYGGPHGRYIMTHGSNRDTFYSDDGGATIRPLGQIPEEAGSMSTDAFAYNPINQVLIVTKATTSNGGRLIWYSNNGGASWTKATNTSAGGQVWNKPYFVAFSYDSNGNPTSGEFRVNTSNDNYITANHARSTDGVNWYPLQGISSGWPGVGHYYHAAADKCVVMEQKPNGTHLAYGSGTGVSLSHSEDLSSMSSFPRESIDGDLEQINQVIYDPYLGKMFMFGGWSPRVWYSDNATHWSRKDLGSISGFNSRSINVINTGSSFLYVMRSYLDFYYTTDPSQNISTWTHETNALEYLSSPGYNCMVNKMIVGGTNGTAVGYYSEYGIAGYSAGYSIGDTVSALTSTTLPGLSASAVSPTSSAPATSEGAISSWDYAEWQLATDHAFTQNVQTSTVPLSSSGTQSGPSFSYNNGTTYFIRTRYASAEPLVRVSNWSSPTNFKTA